MKVCCFGKKKEESDDGGQALAVDSPNDSANDDDTETQAAPLMGFEESVSVWIRGVGFMSPAVCILILVWAIGAIMVDIGTDSTGSIIREIR